MQQSYIGSMTPIRLNLMRFLVKLGRNDYNTLISDMQLLRERSTFSFLFNETQQEYQQFKVKVVKKELFLLFFILYTFRFDLFKVSIGIDYHLKFQLKYSDRFLVFSSIILQYTSSVARLSEKVETSIYFDVLFCLISVCTIYGGEKFSS